MQRKFKKWSPENVLKGRAAETLVNEILRQAGWRVYRFGYEAVLQNLTQIEENALRGDSDIVRQIRSIPDFLAVKSNKPVFIEVKFKARVRENLDSNISEDHDLLSQLERINKFWKAKVIFVTPQEPYFRISYPPYCENDKLHLLPLDTDNELGVTPEILKDFNALVEKYFIKSNQG